FRRERIELHWLRSEMCRYCCKTLFALLIKNSSGCRRDFRVKMWGTSSPDDKLVSDIAKATEAIKIAARRSNRLMAGELSPLHFGLLQQYLPQAAVSNRSKTVSLLDQLVVASQQCGRHVDAKCPTVDMQLHAKE